MQSPMFDRDLQLNLMREQAAGEITEMLAYSLNGYTVFETDSPRTFMRWLENNGISPSSVAPGCLVN